MIISRNFQKKASDKIAKFFNDRYEFEYCIYLKYACQEARNMFYEQKLKRLDIISRTDILFYKYYMNYTKNCEKNKLYEQIEKVPTCISIVERDVRALSLLEILVFSCTFDAKEFINLLVYVLERKHLHKYLVNIFILTPIAVYHKLENNNIVYEINNNIAREINNIEHIIDKFIQNGLICEAAIFAENMKHWQKYTHYIWNNTRDTIILKSFTSSILSAKNSILSGYTICNRQIIPVKLFVINSGRFLKLLFMALEDYYSIYKSLFITDYIISDIINEDIIDDALKNTNNVLGELYVYNECISDLEYLFNHIKSEIIKNMYLSKLAMFKNSSKSISNN